MIDLNGLFRWVTYGGQWSEKRFSKLNNCYSYWINWKSIHCTQVSRIVRRTQLPSEWMNLLANARDFRDFKHYLGPNTRLLAKCFPSKGFTYLIWQREREKCDSSLRNQGSQNVRYFRMCKILQKPWYYFKLHANLTCSNSNWKLIDDVCKKKTAATDPMIRLDTFWHLAKTMNQKLKTMINKSAFRSKFALHPIFIVMDFFLSTGFVKMRINCRCKKSNEFISWGEWVSECVYLPARSHSLKLANGFLHHAFN